MSLFNTYRFIASHPLTRARKADAGAGNTLYEPELIQAVVRASPSYPVLGTEI